MTKQEAEARMRAEQEYHEKTFGKNRFVRTKKQWNALLRTYGIEKLCEVERMTASEIYTLCTESFSQRLARNAKRHIQLSAKEN